MCSNHRLHTDGDSDHAQGVRISLAAKLQWSVICVALLVGVAAALIRGEHRIQPAKPSNADVVFVRDLSAQSREGLALVRGATSASVRDFAAGERRQLAALRHVDGSASDPAGREVGAAGTGGLHRRVRDHLDADRLIARIELSSGTDPALRALAASVERSASAQLGAFSS